MKTEIEIEGTLVITHIRIGDTVFPIGKCEHEDHETVLKDAEAIHEAFDGADVKKRAYKKTGQNKGDIVGRIKENAIYKNVLDDCRHAKTWAEMRVVLKRYYPNYADESNKTATNLYKRAITQGIPSVPLSDIAGGNQKRGRGCKGTVVQKKGGKRPAGAIFFDKSTNIWVKQAEYDVVREYVASHEKFIMRDILTFFAGRMKFYKVKAVIHKLQEESLLIKRSGGANIWTYIAVNISKPAVKSFPENLVSKLSDDALRSEG